MRTANKETDYLMSITNDFKYNKVEALQVHNKPERLSTMAIDRDQNHLLFFGRDLNTGHWLLWSQLGECFQSDMEVL